MLGGDFRARATLGLAAVVVGLSVSGCGAGQSERRAFQAPPDSPAPVAIEIALPAASDAALPPDSPEDVQPLPVGAQMPTLTLKTPEGEDFDLRAAVAEKPTALVFYRGTW
jgi:hypothetical protein